MLIIREAVNKDIKGLGDLFEELTGEKSELERIGETFKSIQNDESYQLLVAEKNGKIVGTIMGILCYDLLKGCKPFMLIKNSVITCSKRGQEIECALRERMKIIARENEVTHIVEEK